MLCRVQRGVRFSTTSSRATRTRRIPRRPKRCVRFQLFLETLVVEMTENRIAEMVKRKRG